MHTIASGAKAVFTNEALRGMEIMRRAAGGHGFLMASGLPGVIQEFSPTPTYEGKYFINIQVKTQFYFYKWQDSY
jgi:acyl-CoA oxidase